MIFLRPWLLLLILIPIVFRLFRERVSASSDWHKVVDKRLLPYLLIPGTHATAAKRSIYKIILWILLCIAAAGPAWDKTPVPSRTEQPGTVIVMELSAAMTGSWLEQAQRKIQDILTELQGEQVGLALYDRFGYTAGPLTFETDIIKKMIPYLDRSILPETRSNPIAGFEQADNLLKNAGIKHGRILFLTSGAFIPQNLSEIMKRYEHKIGILGIGSADPRPIPLPQGGFLTDENNKPVMIRLNADELSQIGIYQQMTPDETDIRILLDKTEPDREGSSHDVIDGVSLWQDRGAWIVVICLPLFALMFRKGVIVLLILGVCLSAEASLWLRPDQEAYLKQIDAVRDYRRHRYKIAGNVFKNGLNPDDWYNWGNALAFQQQIREAINAYKQVLEADPKHEDARFNKEYLERQLEKEEEKKREEEEKKQEEEKKKEEEKKQEEEKKEQEEQQKQLDQLNDMMNQENNLKQEQEKELDKQLNEPEQKPEDKKPDEPEQKPEDKKPDEPEQKPEDKKPDEPEQKPEDKKPDTPQPPKNNLEQLKEELKQEQKQKEEMQKDLKNLNQQDKAKQQEKLKDLSQKIANEMQKKEEHIRELNRQNEPKLDKLQDLMRQENDLKKKELDMLNAMIKPEKQEPEENTPQEAPKTNKTNPQAPLKEPEDKDNQAIPEQEKPEVPKEDIFTEEAKKILNRLENDEGDVLRYRIRQQYLRRVGE